ncbi:hypothetical protein JG687_00007542 [Phytophthora cactorum]|uniref:Uncharacterized protein n=1 Tax=Phytophthora cactorum TaxID=29920 RepID=A0A8T1UK23_9STRA|nr:hypothetical protein JG687_00007542 [Phytophthora cactorum]
MGAEVSKYLEQDALQSDNGVLLENQLMPIGSSVASVRRTSADIANRSQMFEFCQHWDLVRVTEFLRWYTDLVKVKKKKKKKQTDGSGTTLTALLDTSDLHQKVDRLAKEIAVLEDLLEQLETEIESVTETVRSSIQSSAEWHPACTGFAMQRESHAKSALDEFNKDDEKRPLSEEILTEHTNEESNQMPRDGRAKIEAMLKKPRVIKRSIPDLFDASTRSPIFFGYSYEKQTNRVDEALESETASRTREDSIFEMKVKYQEDKLESTLISEKGKIQVLTQKESDFQVKREKHWAKRQAELERAKKELDPNDVFFRTQEAQDEKTKGQEAFEDAELNRQKQSIDTRIKAAERECATFLDQVAGVRYTDRPLGDARLKFHGEELERYDREVNAAKNALASAQEEYAALTTSRLAKMNWNGFAVSTRTNNSSLTVLKKR